MIPVGGEGAVVEGTQALLFPFGQRTPPRAARELDAVVHVPRARRRLRRLDLEILGAERRNGNTALSMRGTVRVGF